MVRSILDGVALGTTHWAEVHNPTRVEGDCQLEQEVCVTAGCAVVQMHVTDWVEAQGEDPLFSAVQCTEEDRFEGTSGRRHLQ